MDRREAECDTEPVFYYALLYDVVADFPARRAPYRTEHLAIVREAHRRGEVLLAGALGDPPDAALLIFRVESVSLVEAFARRDPYVIHGVVVRWQVKQWHVVVEPGL